MTENGQTPEPNEVGTANPQGTSAANTSQPEGSQEQEQEQAPSYVTKADLELFGNSLVTRMKQSSKDQARATEERLQAEIARLKGAGIEPNQQQVDNLRNQIVDEFDQSDTQEPKQASPETSPADVEMQVINGLFEEAGAKVTPNDPEWAEFKKVLDANSNNPMGAVKISAAAFKAAQAKQARVQSNQENADARVVGGGGSSAAGTDVNAPASDLWKKAYKT